LDQLLALRPRAVRAEETLPGLWNLPGNHFFIARDGMRKMIPMASRVLKGKRHRMREQGLLEILTMDDYARRLEHEKSEGRRAAEKTSEGQPERQLSV
jgi:hypothetical protein